MTKFFGQRLCNSSSLKNTHKSYYKYNYSEKNFNLATFVKVRRKSCRRSLDSNDSVDWPTIAQLPHLYHAAITIGKDKKADLMKLCRKNLIPQHHHGFYENLPVPNENSAWTYFLSMLKTLFALCFWCKYFTAKV